MDTPSGEFGYSVKIKDDYALVGSPFESSFSSDSIPVEIPKQGKVYLFKKDEFGYFRNKKTYQPNSIVGDSEKNFGNQINLFGEEIAIGIVTNFIEIIPI